MPRYRGTAMTAKAYDYIIAGGGSAGCVAATRLVRDHGARVLLIERGAARGSRLLAMPAGYMKFLARDDFLEMHEPVPQAQLGGRAPIVPQARLLGGGSAVNAMVYMRGQKEDYDGWDRALGGNSGWSYADMLPHFRRMEHNTRLTDAYHGTAGSLWVSDPGYTCAMTLAFMRAVQATGVPFNADFNGAHQAGVGLMQHTIGNHVRCDARRAFLAQVAADPKLTVATQANVTRILVENGRAVGVSYRRGGEDVEARAKAEVLVAAGSYNTPKLMMLSGLGPADHLAAHGIPVVADLPGVGANLQDHHEVPVVATTNGPFGYFGEDRGWRMLRNGLQYVLFKSGRVLTTGVESCACLDPNGGERPTIQLYCVPTVYLDRDVMGVAPTHGVTLNACLMRPKARGSVRLRSADPMDKPLVDSNYFGEPDDLRLSIAGLRRARDVLAASPVREMIDAEIFPGSAVASDEALAAHCRRTVKTNYHPVGTCRMGADGDPLAVLAKDLRVRGVDGLRVIDASVMPAIVSGNTNAPAMAIAARAVAIMTGETDAARPL
jgi:choline dehydrogenase